jgi:hypothetical protein
VSVTRRPLAGHVKWPFTEGTAYIIEKNFRTLFQDMEITDPLGEASDAPEGTFLRNGTEPRVGPYSAQRSGSSHWVRLTR